MLLTQLPLSLMALLPLMIASTSATPESYAEWLRLTPFADGKVHSNFSFSMTGPWLEDGERIGVNALGEPLLA